MTLIIVLSLLALALLAGREWLKYRRKAKDAEEKLRVSREKARSLGYLAGHYSGYDKYRDLNLWNAVPTGDSTVSDDGFAGSIGSYGYAAGVGYAGGGGDFDSYDDDFDDFINAEVMIHGGDIFNFEDRFDAMTGDFDSIGDYDD